MECTNISMDEFLKRRGLSEEVIQHLKNENIDRTIILVMSDEDLKKIIPKYGDRVALRDFCQKSTSSVKQGLIEKLKEKIESKNAKKDSLVDIVKKTSRKQTRKIEIGWVCEEKKKGSLKQIQTKFGGGTRRISVEKISKCSDILPEAIKLFFPNGKSSRGPKEFFTFDLWDYKREKIDVELTIQEIYEISALTTLRFYLATTYIEGMQIPDNFDDNGNGICMSSECEKGEQSKENVAVIEAVASSSGMSTRNNNKTVKYNYSDDSDDNNSELEPQNELSFLSSGPESSQLLAKYYEDFIINDTLELDESVILINEQNTFELATNFQENPQLTTSSAAESAAVEVKTLILHREHVFDELINAIKTHKVNFEHLNIELVLPNGKPEAAEDLGGVFRDALSEFWQSFYERCTEGTDYKVPFIRHDFGEAEWKAIGKVLRHGFLKEGYFPIKIAPTFIASWLNRKNNEKDLVEDFLKYIDESDRELVTAALIDFNAVDPEELLVFCSSYKSKWLPTKENFNRLIQTLAEQELIQKSAFVTKCFNAEIEDIDEKIKIKDIYENLKPTAKNILCSLTAKEEISKSESKVYEYLKKFIKQSDEKTRSAFLRFCTGSNLIMKKINVEFSCTAGLAPTSHTCSNLLIIPNTYENYVEFRSEFKALLNSNIWVMDMI